ncbi:MAG: hypothetical protein NY202_05915 [Mollicutes bacterium UO1]
MVNEIIIPKENIVKIEEVRYLENNENYQTNKFLKMIIPNAYCMDKEEKQLEGAKETIGAGLAATTAANPVLGGVAGGVSAGVGAVAEGIGKLTGEEGLEKAGNVYKEAPAQPIKEVKKLFE